MMEAHLAEPPRGGLLEVFGDHGRDAPRGVRVEVEAVLDGDPDAVLVLSLIFSVHMFQKQLCRLGSSSIEKLEILLRWAGACLNSGRK